MVISDKAKKLVEEYSAQPNSIRASITTHVDYIKQNFKELCSGKPKDNKEPSKPVTSTYTFSPENKS